MKERPILMTPENGQKCHDGTKTVTRRIMKPQPEYRENASLPGHYGTFTKAGWNIDDPVGRVCVIKECPYGVVGDTLWVREAWRASELLSDQNAVFYKGANAADIQAMVKYRPSIHMPRWACRTVLEITEIRVERVQAITDADCEAEGVRPASEGDGRDWRDHENGWHRTFRQLWESIHGFGAWDRNDWVWVIRLKKVAA